ncbi:DUF5723 family protein [Chitinophaga ginsengisegetis]|uniref:DUF5723 family protein n=1 Tax=Chitinophaga ginsengisegetis TaxID=393003 RepID=UPI000DBA3960|nr:DUF5723 family protein [Chitinophaga ginsengisegetis]MDR6565314.1 hypothetical protein [Chitinophaga ginsengisegetis]MDR6645041.1 hypothetical protein [Chitinophaga ginsengisegetis]MDR6652367.1 hypothetical protein [Chitinophaga ginsengisegetis]
MKRIFTSALLLSCCALSTQAQDLAGFRTSNYAGVTSVFSNPANIADSRYRWDVNLVGVNAGVSNNQLKYKLGDVGSAFGEDTIKSQLFGQGKGLTKALVNLAVYTPSVMFNVGKFSFAVTTRARVVANVTDLDGRLADKIMNDLSATDNLPYNIASNSNMRVSVNAWSEYGVSVAREVITVGPHFLKAGVTLKYLAGSMNGTINIDKLHATMDVDEGQQEAFLTNASGKVGMNFSGMNLSDFKAEDASKMVGHGIGAELGVVYEYRPASENVSEKGSNKYKFRLGLSLMDAGKIKYERDVTRSGTFTIGIPANQQFSLQNLQDVKLDNYKTELGKYPQYFTPAADNNNADYSVSLPTTLQLDGDYHIHHAFYVNANIQLALTSGDKKPYNTQYYSGFSITPRYDGRIFGFFLPVSYNQLSKLNAGASFRVGPLYLGSGSVLSALLGSSHQLDGFVGVRFGGLQRHK